MKKISCLLLCTISLFLLSSCWDKHEIEENIFAVLLGIDKASENDVIVTVSFPLTQTEGGGAIEGMDNGSGSYAVMSVKAATVVEGLDLFSTKLSGPLALYTVKTIVLSRELAEHDMLRHVFSSWRYEKIRNTTNVIVSEGKAADFIKERIKASPIDPLRQEELLLEQTNKSAYYKPIQLLDLITNIKSNSADGVAMYGGIAAEEAQPAEDQKEETTEKSNAEIKEAVKDGYFPDEVPIIAENKSRISGLAVFHGAKMVGALNSSEAQTYALLTQSRVKTIVTLPDPLDPEKDIVVSFLPTKKSRITSSLQKEPSFDITVDLKCTIEAVQGNSKYSFMENYTILTEYLQRVCFTNMQTLILKMQKQYNADLLKLGDKLAYHFRTADAWESYHWPEKYQDTKINLHVSLEVEQNTAVIP